jgi:hypothetical protein
MPGAEKSRRRDAPYDNVWFTRRTWTTFEQRLFRQRGNVPRPSAEIEIARSANFFCGLTKEI